MAYIPLIKSVKWVDLSTEHKNLRVEVENDLKKACVENGNIQPIMLKGAFGIGKSTTLYYLFHYGWEILKTPTFYMPLAKIVDKVKEEASKRESGKVENDQLSGIIKEMLNTQISNLETKDWNSIFDLDFPEFKGKDENNKLSLSDYLKDFKVVEIDTDDDNDDKDFEIFSEQVIRKALATKRTPLLLVDEFESKFYELKRVVESSGGGILRDLFDEIVQTKPFLLVIGNGPASGYEVAKEKGTIGNNDSETAANRRLKTKQIPFPTATLLKQKFMKGCPNGYVNFIWWMSRCRPGHIQKLWDEINYETYKEYDSSDFISRDIFNEPIDESGEEVKYLKTSFFDSRLNSYILPIVGKLLLDFEPQEIKLEDTYKDALKDSDNASYFYCADELVNVRKELLPALKDDLSDYLSECSKQGKYTSINYLINLQRYFSYILSACANKDGDIAFNTPCKNPSRALAESFLIPLLELTYDFVSQYEDGEDSVIKETKDFILDSIKFIEHSDKEESISEKFPSLDDYFSGIKVGKVKSDDDFYLQFSLLAIREFIEQPIGSPKLKYKEMSLETKLSEANLEESVLLTSHDTLNKNKIIFIPVLEDDQLVKYLNRLETYVASKVQELHKDGAKTLRIVYLQQDEKIDELKAKLTTDDNGELLPIAKLKKLVFGDYDNYQFNFGGQISDFIDSVAKIVIAGCACEDMVADDDDTYEIVSAIEHIKDREWTKQKEVVRTIEHYGKLVCEGENSVIRRIKDKSESDYNDALSVAICQKNDYDDNITWDFNTACDATINDEMSKFIGLYYIVEHAQKQQSVNGTLIRLLNSVGRSSNRLTLKPKEDSIIRSLHFDQIASILENPSSVSLLGSFDLEDNTVNHLLKFTQFMMSDEVGCHLSDILKFMKDSLNSHWIGTYNTKMSSLYDNSKGDLMMKMLYLKNYVDSMDLTPIRQKLSERIGEKGKELIEARNSISDNVKNITYNVYSTKYAKDNPDKMPFYHYVEELNVINGLLTSCKRLLSEEPKSVSVLCVVASVIWRIADISHSAIQLSRQISGLLISLNEKKQYIEKNYQSTIDAIYKDHLASTLIGLGEQKIQGQKPCYGDGWCWIEFVRFVRTKNEVQNVLDAKIKAVDEDNLREEDIKTYKNFLQSALTQPCFKSKVDEALSKCKECKSKAEEYNLIYSHIDELLKFDEQ